MLRALYLVLAVAGAVLPLWQYGRHFLSGGSLASLIAAWGETPAAMGMSWDLIVAAVALILWICAETFVRRNWEALWAIPVTCLIGVGCGLPFFLWLRMRPI